MSALENKGAEERKGPHRFKKGTSGNPGGRPKALADVVEMARAHTIVAIEALVRALDNPKTQVAAATALLDRGWGKAKDTVALENESGGPLVVVVKKWGDE